MLLIGFFGGGLPMTACYPSAIPEETVRTVSLLATVCDTGESLPWVFLPFSLNAVPAHVVASSISFVSVQARKAHALRCSSSLPKKMFAAFRFSCTRLSWRHFPEKTYFLIVFAESGNTIGFNHRQRHRRSDARTLIVYLFEYHPYWF